MAVFTGTSHVYNMGGTSGVGKFNKEDLSDLITVIDPTATPFQSNISRATAKATLHEWMIDSLTAAANNANIDGNEVTFSAASSGTRSSNMTQISVKSVIVSGTQDAISKAGKGKEIAYQVAKLTKEIARDMEYALLQNTALVTGDATTARQLKGVAGWITSNAQDAGTGTVTITQTYLDAAAKAAWDDGGKPDMVICNSFNKQKISGFTTGVTKNLDATDKKFVTAVDVYESDFGLMRIYPDHFCVADDVYLIQSDLWAVAYLRPLKVEDLAKTGDAEKKLLVVEYTLECRAEAGNASVIDTATS
ncbi:MAG: DUF5309 domain-containing protein [Thiobacillaceae bacterium]|jgi:hypothetical protein|nr:DUF5309 domain-containing protein [Thiobacillaceae bacterium]